MPDGEVPDQPEGRHVTEALRGRLVAPLSDQERVERERVRNLIQSVASCYNTLLSQETDADRTAELTAKLAFYDDEFRRRDSMTADELHRQPRQAPSAAPPHQRTVATHEQQGREPIEARYSKPVVPLGAPLTAD